MFEFEEHVFEEILKNHDKTKEALLEDVKILNKWIISQPHLPEYLGSKQLLNFLLLNKYSTERVKEKIDNYYTIPTKLADDMLHPKSAEILKSQEIVYYITLPQLTENNYRVFWSKMRNKDRIDELEPITIMNRSIHIQELRLHEDYMFGDIVIFDMEGVNFGFMVKLSPVFITKFLAYYEKVYSIPLKGVYFINTNFLIDSTLKILKTLMKPKLFERIHVCTDTSILENILEKDMIPSDYGGNEQSLEKLQNTLEAKLTEYQKRFDELARFKVDENLRPEKPKNDELLGYYGSFKQINFD